MATLRVPADYSTIADASAVAVSGDVIDVAAGHVDPDERVEVWAGGVLVDEYGGYETTWPDEDVAAFTGMLVFVDGRLEDVI